MPLPLFIKPAGLGAATGAYEAETTALLARFTGTYNTTRQDAINALIKGLKDDGVFSLLDVLQIYAAANSSDALLNWKGTSYTASLVSSPTFTADRGMLTNGSSSYINTGFNPSTGTPNYRLNSAHFSFYSRTAADVDASIDAGATIGVDDYAYIVARRSTGMGIVAINNDGSGFISASVASGGGLSLVVRTSSTAVRFDKNGSTVGTTAYGSGSVPTGSLYVGCRNDSSAPANFGSHEFAVLTAGAGLTTTQSTALYNRLQTYLTAIGANV